MRIVGICFPEALYPSTGTSPNTTLWKGHGIWYMMDIFRMMSLPTDGVSVVTELSPSNITHPILQTVADGRADTVMIQAGMTAERISLVDYSCPVGDTQTKIYSRKPSPSISGDFLTNTFDSYSLFATFLSILAVSFTCWLALHRVKPKLTLGTMVLYNFGNAIGQGQPSVMTEGGSNWIHKFILGFYGATTLVLYKSYSGAIIASLLSKSVPSQINTLWDVAHNPELRLISSKDTYWYADMINHPAKSLFEDRIEVRDVLSRDPVIVKQALSDVMAGTHVLIGHQGTLAELMENTEEFYLDQFHASPPVRTRYMGYVTPKEKSEQVRRFMTGVCWMVAFGNLQEPRPFTHAIRERNSVSLLESHLEANHSRPSCSRVSNQEKQKISARKFQLRARLASEADRESNRSLGLAHFKIVFYMWGMGIAWSIMVFLAEKLTSREGKKGGDQLIELRINAVSGQNKRYQTLFNRYEINKIETK